MDASITTQRKRDKTLHSFFVHTNNKEYFSSNEDLLNRKKGGIIFYEENKVVSDVCDISNNHFTIDESLFYSLEKLLEYCANANLGPTKSSRIFFIWFASIFQGYNWINQTSLLNTFIDNFDYSIRYPLNIFQQKFVWMNRVFNEVCSTIIPTFNINYLLNEERNYLKINIDEQLLLESQHHFVICFANYKMVLNSPLKNCKAIF